MYSSAAADLFESGVTNASNLSRCGPSRLDSQWLDAAMMQTLWGGSFGVVRQVRFPQVAPWGRRTFTMRSSAK